jgi:aminoglycoside/choline kinase family phosphotransferase
LADRARRIEAFLEASDWHGANSRSLAGDASFRSYRRLENGERRAVLMDAPPPHEDVRPFLRIARHLRGLGLSAPEILAEDVGAGLLLLEDLGDDTFTRLLENGAAEEPLYALAIDVLVHLHRLPAAAAMPPALPLYDDARLLEEALLLTDWYMPAALGDATPRAVRHSYIDAWREILPLVGAQPRTLVLRDFHVDNLMRLPGREGTAACGLLDFQDAVAGPAAYDLMSLLEDARRDISDALKATMLARYREGVPGLDWPVFETVLAVLAAQRHAKVIGIFTRLCRRDGKPGYLIHIPRVWRLLETALGHPGLAPVAAWFERFLPRGARGIPTCRPAAE